MPVPLKVAAPTRRCAHWFLCFDTPLKLGMQFYDFGADVIRSRVH
jgi:hypothetical protein